jgi:hypothetical protein
MNRTRTPLRGARIIRINADRDFKGAYGADISGLCQRIGAEGGINISIRDNPSNPRHPRSIS